jgi:two-component system OmpR family sensor kinase
MDQPAQRTEFWRSLRELPGRMPLRTKLISAVLALVAIALVVISAAGVLILRNDLLSTPDSSLQQAIGSTPHAVQNYLIAKSVNQNLTHQETGVALDWVSGGQVQQVIVPVTGLSQGNASGFAPGAPQTMPGPAIQTSGSWLAANSGRIVTLPAQSGGGRWRVLMTPAQVTNQVTGTTVTGTIVLAIDVTDVYTTIGQLAYIDLLVSLVIVCVLGIVGVALIRRSLRPLLDIERTAGAIADGDLSRRVPERDPRTEVGSGARSTSCSVTSRRHSGPARGRRSRRGVLKTGCGSSSPTPATNFAPRSQRSAASRSTTASAAGSTPVTTDRVT